MGERYLEIDFPAIVVFVSVMSTLILQLLLCFKVKRIFIKLLPIALLIVSTIVFSICSASINGWDGLGYLFFALLSVGLIIVCGIGWGVWAIIIKKLTNSNLSNRKKQLLPMMERRWKYEDGSAWLSDVPTMYWGLLGRKKDQKKLIEGLFGEYEVIIVETDHDLPNGGFV